MERAPVYLIERGVWAAEAISKGSYRKIKTDISVARQKRSTVKNSQCLKSMTAFRDLVETQDFSFPTLTHKDECACVCVDVSEGDKDLKYNFSYPWKPIVLVFCKDLKLNFQ